VNLGYFSGAYLNGVDAKHRLSVPAPIRETVEARSQMKCVVLAPAEHAPCLVGYDVGYFEALESQLDARHAGDWGPGRATTARTLFGMADRFRYDDTGRIVLTPVMRELGELEGQVLFVGAGPCFELWSPERLLEAEGQDPRMLKLVRALMAQRAA